MATGLPTDAKHQGCLVEVADPFTGGRRHGSPQADHEHPHSVLADVPRA
jgi:hypothetical protein